MNSSGMKRGLAATAISALAVTGLPFLATSASAQPVASDFGANEVAFYTQQSTGVSAKNDGTNTTISLVVGGGSNVTSVQFQYQTLPGGSVTNIGAPVARNADGVFGIDWTPSFPAGSATVKFFAVPNTGTAETAETQDELILTNTAARTVELATEGSRGVFQAPYASRNGDYVAVTGTSSDAGDIAITALSGAPTGGYTAPAGAATATAPAPTAPATTTEFGAVLDIAGYQYSEGAEANQLVIGAETTNTDDAEASTLYVQTITTASAQANRTSYPAGDADKSDVTVTVLDQNGKPVANASVSYNTPDTAADADTDPQESGDVNYTDAKGKTTFETLGAGTYTFYVNTSVDEAKQNAGDVVAGTITVTEYQATPTSIATSSDESAYDFDEIEADTFQATVKDQNGNASPNQPVQYRWTVNPDGAGDTETTDWMDAGTTNADGEANIPFVDADDLDDYDAPLPLGDYTLEVRRPNVGGTGLITSSPQTFAIGESEIKWADGDSTNSPVNGSDTYEGTLALLDGTPLGDREVTVTWTPGGDVVLAEDQPEGTKRDSATTATATTAEDGTFSVTLEDQPIPPNVTPTTDNGSLNAVASDLVGSDNDSADDTLPANDNADSEDTLAVSFQPQPEVAAIEVKIGELDGQAAPGRPVDLDITVRGEDGVNDNDTSNNPALKDFDVEVSVDKGFLSPNAETVNDLDLAEGHDAVGDLWGYFEQLGADETVSTGDAASAGVVAAMEKDVDFDDDGLSEMTITVKAGDQTVTKTVEFDATNVLNLVEGELTRAAGEPGNPVNTGEEVDFQLYTMDQFGNLVGDRGADISDDSTVADFRTDGEFGETRTDFTVDGPGITAFSEAPAEQTLAARVAGNESLVGPNESQATDATDTLVVQSEMIKWVEGKPKAEVILTGNNNGGKADRLKADAIDKAEGATARLFRKVRDGVWKKVGQKVLNSKGNARFKVADKNGKKLTTYRVKVSETERTLKDRSTFEVR